MKKYVFWCVFLVVFLLSCRSPEKLISRALKINPALKIGQNDTIKLTKFIVDSIPFLVGDSIIFEKIIREVKYDTVIRTNSIYIERKKTRQELRLNYKLEKDNLRLTKKVERLELRLNTKTQKKTIKAGTKKLRIENRNRWWLWLIIGIFVGITFTILITNYFKKWKLLYR